MQARTPRKAGAPFCTLATWSDWCLKELKYLGRPARWGAIQGDNIPLGAAVEMSGLRVLDVYIWSEEAIKKGHPKWLSWWKEHTEPLPPCREKVCITI
jgi:hypothetical protein